MNKKLRNSILIKLLEAEIPDEIAAKAARILASGYDDKWPSCMAILISSFVELYELEGDDALLTLQAVYID